MVKRNEKGQFVKGKAPYPQNVFKKGHVSPMKGNSHSEVTKEKLRKANKGRRLSPRGEFKKHLFVFWHGTKNEYRNLHKRIGRRFGKPTQCEKCKKDKLTGKQIHWANRTGNYTEERKNWLRLCAKCHVLYDREVKNSLIKDARNPIEVQRFETSD